MEAVTLHLANAQQGHAQLNDAWLKVLKPALVNGQQMAVEIKSLEEARSLARNREYWGWVLRPISEQAQIDGVGATAEGWHDYYRLMFLGYEFRKVKLPGMRRPSVRRSLKSTTKLSEKAMREYLEQVRAHAATTFGVTFPAMEEGQ
jgi:hypothetical protein